MATALIFQKGHQVISINMGKQSSCNLGESLLPFMSLAGYFQLALADMVKVNPPLSIYFTGYCTCSHDCSYLHIQVGQWGAIISGLCETVSVCVCHRNERSFLFAHVVPPFCDSQKTASSSHVISRVKGRTLRKGVTRWTAHGDTKRWPPSCRFRDLPGR